ncbi:MAG: EamA family transporter [Planctomycetes bacterium]|nr:EamA family transporter [Planctomycetota bacterium]
MKTLIVLILATLCAAIGETFLSHGMRKLGGVTLSSPSGCLELVLSVVKNVHVTVGVVFLALFFFLYLATLSWADLSFVMPLTSMSYIFAAVLARVFLHERVSWHRWVGTCVILLGITLLAMDDKQRTAATDGKEGLMVGKSAPGEPGR